MRHLPEHRSLFALALLIAVAAAVKADSLSPPRPYKKQSQDGRYVFVSLPHGSSFDPDGLRSRYRRTGLYRTGGSKQPLWTLDWEPADVEVPSDGQSLVAWGGSPSLGDDRLTLAVGFYANGRLVKEYRVRDLVSGPLPESVSHYWWKARSEFQDERQRLLVTTVGGVNDSDGTTYVFDVTSGAIITRIPPSPGSLAAIAAASLIIMSIVIATLFRPRRKKRGVS